MKLQQFLRTAVTLTLFGGHHALAQTYNQTQKLVASDAAAEDVFGSSVSISGDRAIVGTPGDDDHAQDSGAAYVFERDASGIWQEVQKLTASDAGDATSRALFGSSVALTGDRAIVGALGSGYGSAYVFDRDASGTFHEVQKLTPSDGTLVVSVSIWGERAIVGTNRSAHVFERDGTGTWLEVQKLPNSGHPGYVSIFGDCAVVGDNLDNGNGISSGAAFMYERDASGIWQNVQKLTASDGQTGDHFGISVSLCDDRVIVSALGGAGAAYLFERDGAGHWTEVQKLTASDGAADDSFGVSVSISGDRAIVGAFDSDGGSAYIFARDGSGTWSEVQKLAPKDRKDHDQYGVSVSLSGDRAIVGANVNRRSGAAYVYEAAPELRKEIIAGPDEDDDGVPDRVIEVGQATPTEITFTITFHAPDLATPAMIVDTVPPQWELRREDCSTSNAADFLLVFPAGAPGKSATRIQWHPTDNDSVLTCTIRTRPMPNTDPPTFAPGSCGGLTVNNGAAAVDPSTVDPLLDQNGDPIRSNSLCLAALIDLNGDGLDYTGNGDEDGDGLTDYEEACVLGSDPCKFGRANP